MNIKSDTPEVDLILEEVYEAQAPQMIPYQHLQNPGPGQP